MLCSRDPNGQCWPFTFGNDLIGVESGDLPWQFLLNCHTTKCIVVISCAHIHGCELHTRWNISWSLLVNSNDNGSTAFRDIVNSSWKSKGNTWKKVSDSSCLMHRDLRNYIHSKLFSWLTVIISYVHRCNGLVKQDLQSTWCDCPKEILRILQNLIIYDFNIHNLQWTAWLKGYLLVSLCNEIIWS